MSEEKQAEVAVVPENRGLAAHGDAPSIIPAITVLRIVAHFELQALLGRGMLGELHRARDLEVGRTAALRLVAPSIADDEPTRLAVRRAAEQVSAIEHPSIAAVYASGDGPDGVFIASEFVSGQLLSAMLQGAPLHPRRALDLAAQLADGLAQAQAHDVVHGALSTTSVIVTPNGTAKLLDVGLVPWTRHARASSHDDLFGIGALLYEMLVGRPYRPGWPAELRAPELPVDVRPVLQRLLAPRPGEAFESMSTVAAVLRDLGLVLAVRTPVPPAGATSAPEGRGASGTAVVAGLVVVVVLVALLWALSGGVSSPPT